jgi:hypothetical protein
VTIFLATDRDESSCPECGGDGLVYDEAWGGDRMCECRRPKPAPRQMSWDEVEKRAVWGPDPEAGW